MLTTNQKGLIAEQAVIYECVKLGIGVAKPLDDDLAMSLSSEPDGVAVVVKDDSPVVRC